MEQNGNPQLIETLMSRLCQPRTTKERFRLPFDEETAAKLLKCAIAGEVSRFGGTFLYPDAVDSQVRSLAASLTSGRRCGVMLCGLCGNGKTTVMRAFQNLLNVVRIPTATTGMCTVCPSSMRFILPICVGTAIPSSCGCVIWRCSASTTWA